MGQLLIVQGRDSVARLEIFEEGLRLFQVACGLTSCAQLRTDSVSAARFPRLYAPTTEFVRTGDSWLCGVGTWFYPNMNEADSLLKLGSVVRGNLCAIQEDLT